MNEEQDSVGVQSPEPIYTSRIIKASALIADTKLLLSEWDLALPVTENLDRFRQQNLFGKASRSRAIDILKIFRQRYFSDPEIGTMLVTLVQKSAPDAWLIPLLYFFSAQNDRTLRDIVLEIIYPRQQAAYVDLPVEYVVRRLQEWVAEQKTTSEWGEKTILRVAQNALATLRDFGVLEGSQHKQITPFYLPTPSFALVAFWLAHQEQSGNRVLHSEEWKLFFLSTTGVERFFIEAQQEHWLHYQAAGSVVRIDFPASTLSEYAHVLLENAR